MKFYRLSSFTSAHPRGQGPAGSPQRCCSASLIGVTASPARRSNLLVRPEPARPLLASLLCPLRRLLAAVRVLIAWTYVHTGEPAGWPQLLHASSTAS